MLLMSFAFSLNECKYSTLKLAEKMQMWSCGVPFSPTQFYVLLSFLISVELAMACVFFVYNREVGQSLSVSICVYIYQVI